MAWDKKWNCSQGRENIRTNFRKIIDLGDIFEKEVKIQISAIGNLTATTAISSTAAFTTVTPTTATTQNATDIEECK